MKNKYFLFNTAASARVGPIIRPLRAALWGVALIVALLGGLLFVPADEIQADGPDTAHIVVQFAENEAIVRPISFTAPISGLGALQMTDLNLVITDTGFGPAVCAIEGVGDSAANCFSSGFWAYYFWNGSQWESYQVGVSSSVITDGSIELYAWSPAPNFTSPPSPGSGPQFVAAANALDWLAGEQSIADGGYGDISNSVEVLMAIGANHYEGATWQRQSDSPTLSHYIDINGADFSMDGIAAAGKLAVGLSAGGGTYPTGAVQPGSYYLTATGIYTGGFGAGGAGPQSWGMLGEKALSQTIPATATTYLKSIVNADNGWGWSPGNSDTNGTALAIQALIATGEPLSDRTIVCGLDYLKSAQNSDGGFAFDPNSSFSTASDANSTAYAIQAIRAAGQDPLTGTWLISNTNPISYMLGLQLEDGSFEFQSGSGSNQLATQQAVPALLSRPFPVRMTDQPLQMTAAQTDVCATNIFLPVVLKS